jgi:two-component system OmpR family response regulator
MSEEAPKPTVFVVDDDDTSLFILRKYIDRRKQFSLHTFSSGEDCVSELGLKPELVILDYYLNQNDSQMNGNDVVKVIKEKGFNPRIVMLSGQEDGKIVLDLINQGVRDYIIKGENAFSELDEILSDFLRERATK